MTNQILQELQILRHRIDELGGQIAKLEQGLQSEAQQNGLLRRTLYNHAWLNPIPEAAHLPHYLSVACIAKNEGSYLREWLEYHRLVGVEHFYFYDNESTDETRDILDSYIRGGGGRLSLCYRAAHADAGLS